jgi:hypothetical protein
LDAQRAGQAVVTEGEKKEGAEGEKKGETA